MSKSLLAPLLALLLCPLACRQAGQVAGPADAHCAGVTPPVVGVCEAANAPVPDAPNASVYYGSAAQDDDCKYHLSWTVSDAAANSSASIRLTVTDAGGGPVTGGAPTVTASLGGRAAAQTGQQATEDSPGVYLIAPVRLGGAGRWTVRFDLFSACADVLDDSGNVSPRAHAAFWLDVS